MPRRLIVLFAIALAACGAESGSKRSLALADCRLPNLSTAAQCGTLDQALPIGQAVGNGRHRC